ncbi:hypothetical protein BJ986_001795 [Phycicoccus badiiscoriae]|uniref:Lipoprotein n=1 Tax=Pedococcus badiiscoriae TaxID=642776 RepID=A0A852WE49_9MICO|nr:hypothetical protein [Pedococcus badiiscoriae]NYG07308.1 hypothetical protein [Pedococcus badiiscoriae]
MATTPRRRRTLAVAICVVVILALLGGCRVWLTRDDPAPHQGALRLMQGNGSLAAANASGHAPFAAVGSVSQLRPGQLQTLQVKVTNADAVDYRILELTVTPQDANASCSAAANLVVSSYKATKPGARSYLVPRESSITIPLTIMMLNTASSQDGCKNVSFPLAFGGLATQGQGGGSS